MWNPLKACSKDATISLVPSVPTKRQLRILKNLMGNNGIWEKAGRKYFLQFDEHSGKEVRLKSDELHEMAAAGWIQPVRFPPSAQRLDRYEIAELGLAFGRPSPKEPQRASDMSAVEKPRKQA
jgi:hypothetical protein